ncbi:MAG TPA: DNA-formamidopyrimidine glycosylase family protein [Solirubrobacterales bacterium]|nr:DNA-formamidopyrimidine glycosylase family protein [Solirubrobacterales bacterium]
MAEGDTILRAGRRIEAALGGQELRVQAGNGRGRAARVARLDGRMLERVGTHGKHLLLPFEGGLVLHSHLGMNGSWRVGRRGERWRKPASTAWAVLSGERAEAAPSRFPAEPGLTVADARVEPSCQKRSKRRGAMFKCERCGTGYSPMHAAGIDNCPRCMVRDRTAAPLTFKAFELPGSRKSAAGPYTASGSRPSSSLR